MLALVVPVLASVGLFSYLGGKTSVERTTFERLTSVRAGKAHQIEKYFAHIRSQAKIFSESRMIVDAMQDFNGAHQELDGIELSDDHRQEIESYYKNLWTTTQLACWSLMSAVTAYPRRCCR